MSGNRIWAMRRNDLINHSQCPYDEKLLLNHSIDEETKRKVRDDKFVEGYKARDSLVAQTVKNLPTTWEIWVRSLDSGRSLEKRSVHPLPAILTWRIPDRGAWWLLIHGLQTVRHD